MKVSEPTYILEGFENPYLKVLGNHLKNILGLDINKKVLEINVRRIRNPFLRQLVKKKKLFFL